MSAAINAKAPPAPTGVGLPVTVQVSGIPSWSTEPDIGVRHTPTAHLPSADSTAVMLARGVVEVLAGRRAPGQLRTHCAPHVFAGLLLQVPRVARPLPRLLSVRVCEPADGIAEVCVVFREQTQVHAMGFRREGGDDRWRITVLQLG